MKSKHNYLKQPVLMQELVGTRINLKWSLVNNLSFQTLLEIQADKTIAHWKKK